MFVCTALGGIAGQSPKDPGTTVLATTLAASSNYLNSGPDSMLAIRNLDLLIRETTCAPLIAAGCIAYAAQIAAGGNGMLALALVPGTSAKCLQSAAVHLNR